jgi:hypothetical protein
MSLSQAAPPNLAALRHLVERGELGPVLRGLSREVRETGAAEALGVAAQVEFKSKTLKQTSYHTLVASSAELGAINMGSDSVDLQRPALAQGTSATSEDASRV